MRKYLLDAGPLSAWLLGRAGEYNALIIGVCVLLILAGAGAYSLDHAIGWNNIVAGIFHVPA